MKLPARAATLWTPLGLAALTIACKWPTLGTPAYWDEAAWLEQAYQLSQRNLVTALPGLHEPAAFWGHPPLLHAAGAALWQVFGHSLVAARLLIAAFAALGVAATYLLGRAILDSWTGLFAALLLLFSPIYLAQAGFFLGDVPITALGTLAVVLALRGRTAGYVVSATAMVLVKETAIAFIAAFLVYLLLVEGPRSTAVWRRVLLRSVPLWVIGGFFVAQRLATGHFFFIYEFDVALFYLDPSVVAYQVSSITRWIFVEQGRWLFTLVIVVALLVRPALRRARVLLLFALIAGLFGYAFSVLLYLPRYLLPVLPFFYVLGAVCLTELVRRRWLQVAAVTAVLALGLAGLRSRPVHRNGEFDLAYLDVVRLNREMSLYVERRYPTSRILAANPQSRQLGEPRLGYVERARPVVDFDRMPGGDLGAADLVLVSFPWTRGQEALRALARQAGWTLERRLAAGDGEVAVELYARGAQGAAVEHP